ncbi:MAG: glycosyltransferase family 39 protein [Xanthomonadaceae bacterium]|nr:glycosyltransferase family 39 protein [Xanthomonadaceae bacterium]
MSYLRSHPHRFVFLLALVLVFAFQGTRSLWDPTEGRFSNVALQMLSTGDFISLYRHPETLHFTKPPVTYWAIAGSVAAFGWNEWAARLPNALAFLVVVALLLRIGRHFAPRRPWLPALVYATLPIPLLGAHIISTDTMLAATTTLAFAGYAIARFESRPAFILLMWAGFGLAFLTKGPPGLLGLAGILLFHWLQPGGPRLFPPLGLLLFALVGLSWFVVVVARHEGLLAYFVGYEVVARIATDTHGRYPEWWGGFYVYGLTLGLGLLPWWPWALMAARRVGLRWREAEPETRLLLCWIGVAMLVFMVAQSRLPLYVLPLFAPFALLIGRALQDAHFGPLRKGLVAGIVVFAVGIKGLAAYKPEVARALPDHIGERMAVHKVSSLWAEELARLGVPRPEEIGFVADWGRYGLHLYTGASIELLVFEGDPDARPISDSDFDDLLADDLREPGVTEQVFVMRPESEERFAATALEAGWQALRLGTIHERAIYRLLPLPPEAPEVPESAEAPESFESSGAPASPEAAASRTATAAPG